MKQILTTLSNNGCYLYDMGDGGSKKLSSRNNRKTYLALYAT